MYITKTDLSKLYLLEAINLWYKTNICFTKFGLDKGWRRA